MASEVMDAANDVRLAARRLGFRRRHNEHPADSIDDANIAIAALGASFLELDDYPSAEQKEALIRGMRETLKISHKDAEELSILGRWIMSESGGAQPAVTRVTRRLFKLSQQAHFEPLMEIVKEIAKFGDGSLSEKQKTALEDIQRGLRIK
jgi:uncharacterized tellurite resistance protein B-like protein